MGSWRRILVYALLASAWAATCLWQYLEHRRVSHAAYQTLCNRAEDIATSLGIALRSQGRLLGMRPAVIQTAIDDLVTSSETVSIALLNQEGTVVASAGRPLEADAIPAEPGVAVIEDDVLLLATPVDLPWQGQADAPPPEGRGPPPDVRGPPLGRGPPEGRGPAAGGPGKRRGPAERERLRQLLRLPDEGPFWFPRGPGDYAKQRAVHRFIVALTTGRTAADVGRDADLRLLLCGVALLAAAGIGFAWRGLERAAALRVNLVRSEQERAFLEEKSLAAAGLAHETRNPLNVVRGLAQLITRDAAVPEPVRSRAAELMDQADRVANHLQEFIDYAKPIEAKPVPTDLRALVETTVDTLETDRQDKDIRVTIGGASVAVLADPALARQVVFNLILNAYQAVDRGGQVLISIAPGEAGSGAELCVSDDGPGVPLEEREAIFRPYVSLHDRGTGLGLAVVRQICQAHGWRVACEEAPEGGARFRITGMAVAAAAPA